MQIKLFLEMPIKDTKLCKCVHTVILDYTKKGLLGIKQDVGVLNLVSYFFTLNRHHPFRALARGLQIALFPNVELQF